MSKQTSQLKYSEDSFVITRMHDKRVRLPSTALGRSCAGTVVGLAGLLAGLHAAAAQENETETPMFDELKEYRFTRCVTGLLTTGNWRSMASPI